MHEVSIIVPVLNGEGFIPSVGEYISRQSYDSYEALFIISSRCVDGSLSRAEELAKTNERIRVIEYEDTGALGGSKNKGIELATGRYLWFLDVDDIPSYDFLSDMVRIKEENNADLVGCNFVYSDDRSPIPDYPNDFGIRVLTRDEALRARATERFPVTSWSMLYDADAIRREGIRFPMGICEDIVFTYEVLRVSRIVCYYEKPLYKYVFNPYSVTKEKANRDRRGLAEQDRYDFLEAVFSGDPMESYLLRRFTLMRVRSACHMSLSGFLRYIRSDRYVDMMSRAHLAECWGAYMFPVFYYLSIQIFFLAFYYRPGRAFSGGFFEYRSG